MYLFNDSLCVDDLKLKFDNVVVTANGDFYVSGLTVFVSMIHISHFI